MAICACPCGQTFSFDDMSRVRWHLVAAMVLAIAFMAAASLGLARVTYVSAGAVAGCSVLLSLALYPAVRRLWMMVFGEGRPWLYVISQLLSGGVMLMTLFYAVNFVFADDNPVAEAAVVTGIYSEERHHKRRVGRGRYVDGEAYSVYKADVTVSDGLRVTISLTPGEYVRLHAGDSVKMRVAGGLFGFDVVRGRVDGL